VDNFYATLLSIDRYAKCNRILQATFKVTVKNLSGYFLWTRCMAYTVTQCYITSPELSLPRDTVAYYC